MKKNLLALLMGLCSTIVVAQTPRLSLFEEFTGENCPPCASTNPGLNSILSSPTNTPKVVAIKWQVPIPSAPSNTWSLYKTNKTEIDWRYLSTSSGGYGYLSQWTSTTTATSGINAAPTGFFDGQHQWLFGATSDHPAYVSNAVISSAQAIMSPFSVVMVTAWNSGQTALNVTVNIVASQNFTSTGSLVFRAVMVERVVQFSVAPGTNGETKFENPAIASFPSLQAGTPLSTAWVTGQSTTFTLNCPIPSYTRDKNQVDMVGFIQDNGNRKVAQAVRAAQCNLANMNMIATKTVVCTGQSATLSGVGALTYSWSTGETGSSIVVSPAGTTNYWVMNTDPSGCPNIAAITVSVSSCAGLSEAVATDFKLDVYPNPSNGEFVINTNLNDENARLVMYNTLGQKVYEQALKAGTSTIKTNLPKGIYNLQVARAAKTSFAGKVVIE